MNLENRSEEKPASRDSSISLIKGNEPLKSNTELITMLSLSVEQSPISIVITDLEGTIEFVNPKFTEITGYTLEEVIGKNPRILRSDQTPAEVHRQLWDTIKNGGIWEGEFINKKKDGALFTESAKIAPFKNSHGQITHYLAFKEDITARKSVEAELQRLNISLLGRIDEETTRRMQQERLIANQARLVAMGEMIGAIAHQWRQPLATLAMVVQRLHAVGCKQELAHGQLEEFKGNAMRQIKYMSETIEEFSGFYSKEKRSELFSPINCINDAVRLFDTQFASNNILVTIHTNNNIDLLVPGFPNEFKQVILNLLGNARDAILESRITRCNHEQGRIDIDIFINEERKLIIDIGDNGCGIPDSIINRIFDPYFTTKAETGGTGIGLYMSRMIMLESLGGFLKLQRAENGAIFRIKLPLGELS
jgi:PAS domain S-box-containing protein